MLSEAELDALANDIQEHGLRQSIVLWRDGTPDNRVFVLDGRNRLEALTRLGCTSYIQPATLFSRTDR